MYYKILLPVDGSKESYHALDQAMFLARCIVHAKVTVLHVLHSSQHQEDSNGVESKYSQNKRERESEQRGNKLLMTFGEKLQASGIPYELDLKRGYPSKVISDVVEEETYDLVVIGNRGFGMFGEFVLGSVSHKVLHLVTCPVMVVR